MVWLREWGRRLKALWRRERISCELQEEMQFHLEMQAAENREAGMDSEEALFAARRKLGNTALLAEDGRGAWGWSGVENVLRDFRHGMSLLGRSPGFTAVVVLTLALGIGANTAIFSLTHALLLRSLPVPDAENLRVLRQQTPQGERMVFSMAAIAGFARARSVETAAAYGAQGPALIAGRDGALETVHREQASSFYFAALRIQPAAGRFFSADEDRGPSGNVVISYDYWRRRYNLDPGAIGSQLEFVRRQHTVIGVAPPRFKGFAPERSVDLWFPIGGSRPQCLADAACEGYKAIVRLRPGVAESQAAAELKGIFRGHLEERATRLSQADRERLLERDLTVQYAGSGDSFVGRKFGKSLAILMALVGLLLLLACANIGNLLLARGAARSREMAIRLAIGASRWQLVRQMLIESLMLAAAGGALAVPLAWWAAGAMVRAYTDPRTHLTIDVAPDLSVFGYALAISLIAGLVFGTLPAWRATRTDAAPVLQGSASFVFRGRRAAGKLLAVAQVALSIFILAGAALFIRSLVKVRTTDGGYVPESVIVFSVGTESGYGMNVDPAIWRLLDKVRNLPGVVAVSSASPAPPNGGPLFKVKVEGYLPRVAEDNDVKIIDVTEGFFETVRTPLIRGRLLTESDRVDKLSVAVVNQGFARKFFGDRDPVGRTIEVGSNYEGALSLDAGGRAGQPTRIVGVVADARYSHPKESPVPTVFPIARSLWASGIVVRTANDPAVFLGSLPQMVRELEPSLRVLEAQKMTGLMDYALTQERMLADLSGAFGMLGLLLASLGIYAVMAYGVRQRTAEIGVRVAMGASGRSILWMVLRETALLLAAGVMLGVPAVLACGRLVASLLFEMDPADLPAIGIAVGTLTVVALLAGYFPARQAARLDPSKALRVG